MKQAGWFPLFAGLTLSLASCGGGGGGGGGGKMVIETCSLGCTNGTGGSQVSCGLVNTYQNQEVAVLFSEAVSLSSVSKLSFQVFNVGTGSIPAGSYLVDPTNSRRLIFRPKLSFNSQGHPLFGFENGASYRIYIPGTTQGDPAPHVRSLGNRPNESRLLCTIVTDQGIIDPVPGPPSVAIYVDTVDPITNQVTTGVLANNAINVSTESDVTFVFDDLMNISTIVVPATGIAPFIQVLVDPDGNLADPSDQVEIGGTYSFVVDQVNLRTVTKFKPTSGFPSAGFNPSQPRKIVVRVPSAVRDLAGNGVANAGTISFVPQAVTFPEATIPPGGEQFVDKANEKSSRSGADWGVAEVGRLRPGYGGGSGRMGELVVKAGQTVTLATGPVAASGQIVFSGNPANNSTVTINGVVFTILDNPAVSPVQVKRRGYTAYTLTELVRKLNSSTNALVDQASYALSGSNTLVITHNTPGPNTTFTLAAGGTSAGIPTTQTLTGGKLGETFDSTDLITNFDFQANPAGTPAPILVSDGVFEFARIEVQNSGTLRLQGVNPARVLSRGDFTVQGLGVIDVSGQDRGTHRSDDPLGQRGGLGGPGGASGGSGGDRTDFTGSDLLTLFPSANPDLAGFNGAGIYSRALENPGAVPVGRPGGPITDLPGIPTNGLGAAGAGGVRWPSSFPTTRFMLGGLGTNSPACESEMVGGAGGGGAYAINGGQGIAVATSPNSAQTPSVPNAPGPTAGGDAGEAMLEPAGSSLSVRSLDPKFGFLRGGSGGGGGGSHLKQTVAGELPFNTCVPSLSFSEINTWRDHSGAGGGGGGGAVQMVAGSQLLLDGIVNATGGDGGRRFTGTPINAQAASPGGGGSGGAVLLQARDLQVSVSPNRISIVGGAGGDGVTTSLGGAGGAGLVRAEGRNPLTLANLAPSINPFFNVPDQSNPGDPQAAIHWLSVGMWSRSTVAPTSFSGSESCWMRPPGNFFQIQFNDDQPGDPGWDMDVFLLLGGIGQPATQVSFRDSTVFGGLSPQQHWGELLGVDLQVGETGAPIVVRFQGAKSISIPVDFCNVDIDDPNGPVKPGSVTPWVRHPRELNAFSPRPDMIRFVVIFDVSHPDIGIIRGVTNLRAEAQPD